MSVALNRKSEEVEEDSVNLMATDYRSNYRWRNQISVWWIGAAAVCLGFLLLILILGVVAHNSSAIGQDSKRENLIYSLTTISSNMTKEMEVLQKQFNTMLQEQKQTLGDDRDRDQLKIRFSNLTEGMEVLQRQFNTMLQEQKDTLRNERDQLKIRFSNLTKEMEVLQNQFNAMAASRAKLQEEVNRFNLNSTGKPCYQGWKTFENKCYYLSATGVTKTWESSRKDCKERGADLAIITTKEELNFVSRTYAVTWIGLSDKDQENKWKWVDGSDLVGDEFWQDGEPNNSDGNEDCAEVSRSAKRFNDVPCTRKFSWACEN